ARHRSVPPPSCLAPSDRQLPTREYLPRLDWLPTPFRPRPAPGVATALGGPAPEPAQNGDRPVPTFGLAESAQAPEFCAVGVPGSGRVNNAATPIADAAPTPRAAPAQRAFHDRRCGATRRVPNRLPDITGQGAARLADVPARPRRHPAGGAVAPARYGRRLDRHSTAIEPRTQPAHWQRPVAAPQALAHQSVNEPLRCAHCVRDQSIKAPATYPAALPARGRRRLELHDVPARRGHLGQRTALAIARALAVFATVPRCLHAPARA